MLMQILSQLCVFWIWWLVWSHWSKVYILLFFFFWTPTETQYFTAFVTLIIFLLTLFQLFDLTDEIYSPFIYTKPIFRMARSLAWSKILELQDENLITLPLLVQGGAWPWLKAEGDRETVTLFALQRAPEALLWPPLPEITSCMFLTALPWFPYSSTNFVWLLPLEISVHHVLLQKLLWVNLNQESLRRYTMKCLFRYSG